MKKLSISIVWTFLFTSLLFGQVTLFRTYDTIKYYDFIQSEGFYMLGDHYVYPKKDIILQSTDTGGEINWIKQYNYEEYLQCRDFLRNQEGNFLILGVESGRESGNPSDTSSNIYIIKTESDGDTIWTSKIDIKKFDYPEAIIEDESGGYLITGSIKDDKYSQSSDILLAKINENGELQWYKTFGGSKSDKGGDIIKDADAGYYITGSYVDGLTGSSSAFLLKTNASGDSLWMRKYDCPDNLLVSKLLRTSDDGFLITVNKASYPMDPELIKTNATGDTIWTRIYDQGNGDKFFGAIIQTSDKGFMIGGYSEGATGVRPPWSQMTVYKMDSIGKITWQRKYLEDIWSDKIFKSISCLSEQNNNYIFLGINETYKRTHLFKLDKNGCYLQNPLIKGNNFFCSGDSTMIYTTAANNSLSWSTGSTSESIFVNTPGQYFISVTDTNNCLLLPDTISIVRKSLPDLNIEPDGPTTICSGDSVILSAYIGNYDPHLHYSYSWLPGQNTHYEMVTYNTGMFSLQVDDGFCKSADSLEVVVHYPSQEKICLVTVDRTTGRNLIVWERTPEKGTAFYNVYREDEIIGTVPYSDLSVFADMTADPEKRAHIYQISAVDTCGNESILSPYHKPHFLQFVSTDGGVNLGWDDYLVEGDSMNFINYTIYRGGDSVVLSPLEANVPRLIHNYTDTDPSTRTTKYYYRIAGNLSDACYPSSDIKADAGPYSHSMSNIEENRLQNHSPTDILIGNNEIEENLPEYAFVGRFTTIDQDTAESHVYFLVSGEGDADNASFTISGDSLLCVESLDFETQNSYSIRIQCMDNSIDNLTFEKTFTIVVNDIIESGFAEVYMKHLAVYPNPFTNSTTIQFDNPGRIQYTLHLRDISGKTICVTENIFDDKVEIFRNDLPPGIYFVELRGARVFRGKLVIE